MHEPRIKPGKELGFALLLSCADYGQGKQLSCIMG
jgi:hypothetical protein